MTRYELACADGSFDVSVERVGEGFQAKIDDGVYKLKLKRGTGRNSFVVEVGGKPASITLLEASSQRVDLILDGERLSFQRPAAAIGQSPELISVPGTSRDIVAAPMPGKVIGALVKKGERVKAGDPLVILESMKMEIAVRSDREAEVAEILVEEGASVKRGQGLVRLAD